MKMTEKGTNNARQKINNLQKHIEHIINLIP